LQRARQTDGYNIYDYDVINYNITIIIITHHMRIFLQTLTVVLRNDDRSKFARASVSPLHNMLRLYKLKNAQKSASAAG